MGKYDLSYNQWNAGKDEIPANINVRTSKEGAERVNKRNKLGGANRSAVVRVAGGVWTVAHIV